jgi:hypothetical protein
VVEDVSTGKPSYFDWFVIICSDDNYP